jgi:thioredoxin-related protein
LGVTYPAGYTDEAQVVRDYRVRAMPTTVFITAEGEVFRTWTGSITGEVVTAIVREMLEEE